ncbi:MAG: histidine phosphatase family protein [Actinomycetota bacterium]|nr:histidine phosphatase family protein [Actinomycetota bacterium]
MTERVFLARHALARSNERGLASYAAPGEGLTPEGIAQARRLGGSLVGEEIALGVATELRRTQETLDAALEGRYVPRIVVSELNEIHFGSFDGGLLSAYREWAGAEAPGLPAPGGGESRAQAAARYATGLRLLLARPEESALVIGHALAVRYIVDAAEGLVPAPLMLAPVEHALSHRLTADELEAAVELLEEWSLDPRFRDPP